ATRVGDVRLTVGRCKPFKHATRFVHRIGRRVSRTLQRAQGKKYRHSGWRRCHVFVIVEQHRCAGPPSKRDWLRASVGVQSKLGGGTLTLMLNSSTQGTAPIHWLNVSYQVAF